jgi:hypothetical protein
VFAAIGWTLGVVGTAQAASSLTLTIGSDPAESITTQIGATGSAQDSGGDYVHVHLKPAGGTPCAAIYTADNGTFVISAGDNGKLSGAFSVSTNWTFNSAGSYVLCGWLTDSTAQTVYATASMPISVRAPHLSISISAPATVVRDQTFQIVTTAQAETQRTLYEYVMPDTGAACPANAGAMPNTATEVMDSWNVDGGPLAQSANESFSSVGTYLVCAYFEYPQNDSPPEATATATVSVVKHLPKKAIAASCQLTSLTVSVGQKDVGNCTVPGVPARTRVQIQYRNASGGWTTAVYGRVTRQGTFHFHLKGKHPTSYQLAILVNGDKTYATTRVPIGTLTIT